MLVVGVRAAPAEMWDKWEGSEDWDGLGRLGGLGRLRGLGRVGRVDGWDGWDEWDRWDGCNGRVLIKILAIEKKILPLLKVKNIVLIRNAITEYGDCRVRMSP